MDISKIVRTILIVLIASFICFAWIESYKHVYGELPKIVLPLEAHHTVGQIAVFEHFDDGDLGGKPGYNNFIKSGNVYPTDEFKNFLKTLTPLEQKNIKWVDSGKGYVIIDNESDYKYWKSGAMLTNDFSFSMTTSSQENEILEFVREAKYNKKGKKLGRYGAVECNTITIFK